MWRAIPLVRGSVSGAYRPPAAEYRPPAAELSLPAPEPADPETGPGASTTGEEFADFVDLRWQSLVRFGFLLTGDWGAAEDLTQSALERTGRRWRRVKVERPERYVKAAMINQMRSRWRRRDLEVVDGVTRDEPGPSSGHPDDHALHDALWSELLRLPVRMRAVIVLRIWEDLSEAETARVLGCSV